MTGNRILDFFLILIGIVIVVIVLFKLLDVLDNETARAYLALLELYS